MSEKKHERGKEKISIEDLTPEEIKERYTSVINKRRDAQRIAYEKLKNDPERKKLQDERRRAYQNEYYKNNKEKFKARNAANRKRYKEIKAAEAEEQKLMKEAAEKK